MAGRRLSRAKVYDPVLRIIHAWNGLAILLLLLGSQVAGWLDYTPEGISLWRFHTWTGYALVLGLAARIVWGWNGPEHARLAALWQPRAWLDAARSRRPWGRPTRFGHHPLAALVYIGFYLMLLVMAASGLALAAIEQGRGPLYAWLGHDVALKSLFKTPHGLLDELVLGFLVAHVAALILHESRHGVPMAQAMVSGYQYLTEEQEE